MEGYGGGSAGPRDMTEQTRAREIGTLVGRVLRGATGVAAAAVLAAAIIQELRRPKEQREWHGTVARFVPYDFRKPTLERVRSTHWSPDEGVWRPRTFGVGWSVNLGRVARLASRSHNGHGASSDS